MMDRKNTLGFLWINTASAGDKYGTIKEVDGEEIVCEKMADIHEDWQTEEAISA